MPAAVAPDAVPEPSTGLPAAWADAAGDSTSVPDSLHSALDEAIGAVSALFDVPDSVVRGMSRLVDVDSVSGVDGGEEPSWDIEVNSYLTQEKVAFFVERYLGSARTRFVEWLQRGKQYEPIIREKFREAGIPEDMYYLALVESGYDPHAYSRAAAVGMWQFMSSTARGVGLRVDWWIDERRDPMRSTEAAARFIRDLRAQFGSLYLAAAAYNGGPGRVSRGLKMYDSALEDVSGEDCFFALAERDYLRTETKNYVPQLIAAALIGKTPGRYGITLDSVPRFAYDSVIVPSSTPLAAVALAAGIPVRDVQALNPHVLRGVTPSGADMPVRVPLGKAEGFDSLFAALDSAERVAFVRAKPKSGETLVAFSKRHGVTSKQLGWYNPSLKVAKGRLVGGQQVLVPTPAALVGALDVPNPSIERYGTAGAARSGQVTHVVKRGETLGGIAKRYGTSVSSLVALNRLKKNVIYPGQSIIVRTGSTAKGSTAKRSAAPALRASSSAAKGTSAKGSAAKKSSAKGTAAKGTAAKGTAAKGTAAKGTAAKGTAAKGTAAKGTAAKGTAAKGTAAKGTAATKPAAKGAAATGTTTKATTPSTPTQAPATRTAAPGKKAAAR